MADVASTGSTVEVNARMFAANLGPGGIFRFLYRGKEGRNHWVLKGSGREEGYDNIAGVIVRGLRRVHGGNEKIIVTFARVLVERRVRH